MYFPFVGLALAASGCGKSDSVGAYQKELQMREKAVSYRREAAE